MARTRILGQLLALALFGYLTRAQEENEVEFPPGRPTSENIHRICLQGKTRPRYPEIPLNRGTLLREAEVIHRIEAWYSQLCCKGQWEQDLDTAVCCAQNAWKTALDLMCEEETMIKFRQRSCCKMAGAARELCFSRMAPNPSYQITTPYSGADVLPAGPVPEFPRTCSRKQ